ncbi:hypothetical protein PG993_005060 [Apiospora rasikravindrae]|uniref:Uncharacterized protein n=1 Tax=Apiospora rasikravindrae TaxID=990691 RepID=A0ABR1TGD6_9PEZI
MADYLDDDRLAPVAVGRVEDLTDADKNWFYREALHVIRKTIPGVVLNDLCNPDERFSAPAVITMPPPLANDLPRRTNTRDDWAKTLERESADIERHQRDALRKRDAAAYLRARVDRIDDSVVFDLMQQPSLIYYPKTDEIDSEASYDSHYGHITMLRKAEMRRKLKSPWPSG